VSASGWPSLCLRCTDLEAGKRFYEAIGLRTIEVIPEKRVVMGYGAFRLALMTFLEEDCINVRGGDVFAAHDTLRAACPGIEGEPERYTPAKYDADADGTCWYTHDPDGHGVFFDTNENEIGPDHVRRRTRDVLDGAIEELSAIGADTAVVAGLERLRAAQDGH